MEFYGIGKLLHEKNPAAPNRKEVFGRCGVGYALIVKAAAFVRDSYGEMAFEFSKLYY